MLACRVCSDWQPLAPQIAPTMLLTFNSAMRSMADLFDYQELTAGLARRFVTRYLHLPTSRLSLTLTTSVCPFKATNELIFSLGRRRGSPVAVVPEADIDAFVAAVEVANKMTTMDQTLGCNLWMTSRQHQTRRMCSTFSTAQRHRRSQVSFSPAKSA